jgi:hypothetical protein
MQTKNNNTPNIERPMLRMGSIAFIAGVVILLVSTIVFHASSKDPMDNPVVFAVYAQSDTWIAAHIGQFAGVMLVFAGGFVALHRLIIRSESGVASALAWFGLVTAIIAASTYAILQAVDGIANKIADESWYAISPSSSSTAGSEQEEKAIAFRVAEGIRWTEIGINSYNRMLQGTVGIAVGAAGMAAGVITAYFGFSDPVADLVLLLYAWIVVLGIFMWRKTMSKKLISR